MTFRSFYCNYQYLLTPPRTLRATNTFIHTIFIKDVFLKGVPPLLFAGKDKIIFVTKEDHEAPSSAELVEEDPNDPYEERGEGFLIFIFVFFTLECTFSAMHAFRLPLSS